MPSLREFIKIKGNRLPRLENLETIMKVDPKKMFSDAFPPHELNLRTRYPSDIRETNTGTFRAIQIGGRDKPKLVYDELDVNENRLSIIKGAQSAVEKIKDKGDNAELNPDETQGLEAIICVYGRPAILIQDGHFFPPPEEWKILENKRKEIEKCCQSVGRIEVSGHPSLDWIGTGFLVADDLIMTNRHVAKEFCTRNQKGKWMFEPGMQACIDFKEELGALESAEFEIKKVINIHERLDLALLKVATSSKDGKEFPEPLTLASEGFDNPEGRKIYLSGYPAMDPQRNDPEIMRKIFNNIYGVKRLQPGTVTSLQEQQLILQHDCSSLGGNSGSCVIDLEQNVAIGLHFGGRYLESNYAVALWTLQNDPMIKKAGINYN